MDGMNPRAAWRVTATGSVEHGWMVDVHDGVRNEVYSGPANSREEAEKLGGDAHEAKYVAPAAEATKEPEAPAEPVPPIPAAAKPAEPEKPAEPANDPAPGFQPAG